VKLVHLVGLITQKHNSSLGCCNSALLEQSRSARLTQERAAFMANELNRTSNISKCIINHSVDTLQ